MNMIELPASERPVDIPAMATRVRAIVRDALRAFIDGDTELAKHVLKADDEVDPINRDAKPSLGFRGPRARMPSPRCRLWT